MGEGKGKSFIMQIVSSSFWGVLEKAYVKDYLIDVDQKIPDWLIKVMCLREAETAIRLGIKSRFGIMGF